MQVLEAIFRWIHVVAGIMWIGHLYFFNFVNGPFQGTMDGETKKKVNPELLPRALFWFRWGAAWTWVSGILLLMIAVNLLAFVLYDVIVKLDFAKNLTTLFVVGLILVAIVVVCDVYVGG